MKEQDDRGDILGYAAILRCPKLHARNRVRNFDRCAFLHSLEPPQAAVVRKAQSRRATCCN